MSLYFTNIGELELMRSILAMQEWNVGLYKNVLSADGSLTMLSVVEMPTGSSRAYVRKTLTMDFAEAASANKWYLSLNSAGKAEGIYHNTYLDFEFNSYDVLDVNTVYGVFGFCIIVPFDAGLAAGPPAVGATITGAGGATGIVTGVILTSGTWAGGTAAGYFFVKTRNATAFVNNEVISVGATPMATSNTGTLFGGDAHKQLLWLEELPEAKLIDTAGQKIRVIVKWSLSTA
jgi:hypothetical protein